MLQRKIWIPSKQEFFIFDELSCIEYKNIHQVLNDEEFIEVLNSIIKSTSKDKDILQKITIFDRFIIILFLKIYSCGKNLTVVRKCDKCKTETTVDIDLNGTVDTFAQKLDKDFRYNYEISDSIRILCNIPKIGLYDRIIDSKSSMVCPEDMYILSCLEGFHINNDIINISEYSLKEIYSMMDNIGYKSIENIRKRYIDNINDTFNDTKLFSIKCSNTSCNDTIDFNFNLSNFNELLKLIFRDDNYENILSVISAVSSHCHFDYRFYENMSPLDISTIYAQINKSISSSKENLPAENNNDVDLFNQYRNETKNMTESPSDFK